MYADDDFIAYPTLEARELQTFAFCHAKHAALMNMAIVKVKRVIVSALRRVAGGKLPIF